MSEISAIGPSTNIITTFLDRPGLKVLVLLGGLGSSRWRRVIPTRAKLFLIR